MQSQFLMNDEVEELVKRLSQPIQEGQTSVREVAEVTGLTDTQVAHELEKMRLERKVKELESQIQQMKNAEASHTNSYMQRRWRSSRFGEFNGPIRLLIIFVGLSILTLAHGFSHFLNHFVH